MGQLWTIATVAVRILVILRVAFSRASPPLAVVTGGVLLAGCAAAAQPGDFPAEAPRTNGAPVTVAHSEEVVSIDVSLEALLGYTPPAVDERRNPFRFGPASDGDGRDLPGPGASVAVPADIARLLHSPGPSAALAAAAVPSTSPVRFIGFVEVPGRDRRAAVLTDGDGVHHGELNDVVVGRYRIVALGATSVEIEDLAHGTRRVLQPSVP